MTAIAARRQATRSMRFVIGMELLWVLIADGQAFQLILRQSRHPLFNGALSNFIALVTLFAIWLAITQFVQACTEMHIGPANLMPDGRGKPSRSVGREVPLEPQIAAEVVAVPTLSAWVDSMMRAVARGLRPTPRSTALRTGFTARPTAGQAGAGAPRLRGEGSPVNMIDAIHPSAFRTRLYIRTGRQGGVAWPH